MTDTESSIFAYNKAPEGWTLLSAVDESEPYEVDMAEIWRTAEGRFALVTASGCSCWDGEYDSDEFDSLELLAVSLLREERTYNPSLSGALTLLTDAVAANAKS